MVAAVVVVVALMLLAVGARNITIVPDDSAYVVERLGRYRCTLRPGLHVLAPFIDRVAFRYSLLPSESELSATAITRDNVPVRVASSIRWRIADAQKAAYASADVAAFIAAIVQTAQRQWIGEHSFDDARESTRALEAAVERSAADAAAGAGAEIAAVSVRNIERAG